MAGSWAADRAPIVGHAGLWRQRHATVAVMADPVDQSGLRPDRILSTLEQLHARIVERFPESGLSRVCRTLIDTARWSIADARELARPNWRWRAGVAGVVVTGILAQIWALRLLNFGRLTTLDPPSIVQGLE